MNIEEHSMTPAKKVSFIQIPEMYHSQQETSDIYSTASVEAEKNKTSCSDTSRSDANSSIHDKSVELKLCSEAEAKESAWPEALKCRYHDIK